MLERYHISKVGDFYELFDWEDKITLFANLDRGEVEKVKEYYDEYGFIPEEI